MRILVACEFSGIIRNEFAKLGHDAWSCDFLPSEITGNHYQGDVVDIISKGWDLMIAHPPCTYLCVTGNKWMKPEYVDRFPDREQKREEAILFFLILSDAPIPRICIENPVGIMSTEWRKPDQYIQPYMFGDPHPKKTGLWLINLPLLTPTKIVTPNLYTYKDGRHDSIWHMETMKLPPLERMKARSRTFPGIAKAMAEQWGSNNAL